MVIIDGGTHRAGPGHHQAVADQLRGGERCLGSTVGSEPPAWNKLRDFFDRRDLGMILIGIVGFDRQLARHPQLYSRIGFAHQYKPLDSDDLSYGTPTTRRRHPSGRRAAVP